MSHQNLHSGEFPYFFVGTFIEAQSPPSPTDTMAIFPYFFVGTFIEARVDARLGFLTEGISLLFRGDFH